MTAHRDETGLLLRGAAWWIAVVGIAFWLLDYCGKMSVMSLCVGEPWVVTPGRASAGAWLLLGATAATAVELWRLARIGVAGAVFLLTTIVIAGAWQFMGYGHYMAAVFLLINAVILIALIRHGAWRTCRSWL